jgi:hypothetical protein
MTTPTSNLRTGGQILVDALKTHGIPPFFRPPLSV